MKRFFLVIFSFLILLPSLAQETGNVSGRVYNSGGYIPFAAIAVPAQGKGTTADSLGHFMLRGLKTGTFEISVAQIGYRTATITVTVKANETINIRVLLEPGNLQQQEVIIEAERSDAYIIPSSPPKVEVITWKQVQAFASSNLMDAVGRVNGLREQLNCGVCNTSDIHINGMEGPYTLVLIDGRPVMGGLSSVYGMNGIAASVIDRVEITKGPVAARFGAEAMGGVINVITKNASQAGKFSVSSFYETSGARNVDAHVAVPLKKSSLMFSGNYFGNEQFNDAGGDNFSDVVMTQRASLFGKLSMPSRAGQPFWLTAKGYYEDRFGGQRGYSTTLRGSDSIYGESILTKRTEIISTIPLRSRKGITRIEISGSWHNQDSRYGTTAYIAEEGIANVFGTWTRSLLRHDIETGIGFRGILYDDNTPATLEKERILQPGFYLQDDIAATEQLHLQPGVRFDYHPSHGLIFSPRFHSKWNAGSRTTIRFGAGKGFRVVRLFTEDHAALTGSRTVVISENLEPERSLNFTANLLHDFFFRKSWITIDADLFYTHFSNRILPDYNTDQNKIIYSNLGGHSVTRGAALNLSFSGEHPIKARGGITFSDVYAVENDLRSVPEFSPRWSGISSFSVNLKRWKTMLDYSMSFNGPMQLPEYDPPFSRETMSHWFALHHFQFTVNAWKKSEFFGGVKNMFNFFQPNPLIDAANPFSDNFDTAYAWGPLQGRRWFAGFRCKF